MGYEIFPAYLPALLSAAAALLCAVFIFVSRPGRAQNRALASLLLIESSLFAMGESIMYMADDPRSAFAYQVLTYALMFTLPALYVTFLGTLDTPLSRILRSRWVLALVWGLGIAGALAVIFRAELFVGVPVRFPAGVQGHWTVDPAPLARLPFIPYLAALLLGIGVAILARASAKTPLARRQTNVYLGAFVVRDTLFAIVILIIVQAIPLPFDYISGWFGAAGYFAFAVTITYGILKAQLFDIDIKVKWTIRRGTLVGLFAVAVVGAGQAASEYASDAYGYLAGALAAVVMLLALKPLDRFSARVADAALPRVSATPDYVAYRKMEVYRAALEGAWQDGDMTAKEREVLRRLRATLGISDADAAALERDLVGHA